MIWTKIKLYGFILIGLLLAGFGARWQYVEKKVKKQKKEIKIKDAQILQDKKTDASDAEIDSKYSDLKRESENDKDVVPSHLDSDW